MPPRKIEDKYQSKDLREFIYEIPDTYAGSDQPTQVFTYVYDEGRMVPRMLTYVPALYKCYDEILVNALDQVTRLKMATGDDIRPVKNIKISIEKDTGYIEVYNDGDGVEIEHHQTLGVYVPEMIFGNLLTSANYNKNEEKIVGGKNGVGAKIANIFAKEFIVETVDHRQKKIYTQRFADNMKIKGEPTIKACAKAPYTKVRWLPDYARFGLDSISDDMYALFHKRALDACATTDATVFVHFNGEKLAYKTFEAYVDLYLGPKADHPRVFDKSECGRWEIAASYSPMGCFEQISFVNGIATIRGGKHVDYIANQITKKLGEAIQAKKKREVKPQHLRDNLVVFVKSLIVNPNFDGQTKENLTTQVAKFGSKFEIDDEFIKKLFKTGICEKAISLTDYHENKKLSKSDGKKTNRVLIPKLDDAAIAGGKNSAEATLILTEGDSARSLAISGLSVIGREKFGVFPLKGKILNVQNEGLVKISENQEITALKKILGLENGKNYADASGLRYGSIMAMTDADSDGSHIKGLLFNLFQSMWPSLAKMPGFLTSMQTPIMKVSRAGDVRYFYNMNDFQAWLNATPGAGRTYKITYLKGLGSSTEADAKHYFREMRRVKYLHTGPASDTALDLAFNKDRANDRKDWLMQYNREVNISPDAVEVPYEEFIHKELIHFSNRDVERSIGNIADGLKESQRKILYACFKRRLFTSEIKVAQLGGYVSETACYHHGEKSLFGAIVGMAQNFVGSNNMPLLVPEGQFGTRLQGGKDAASERYIFTRLSDLARKLFPEEDFPILKYLDDDGTPVEPEYYMPIIPLVLINGMKGIGTGFSTSLPCHNPSDIIAICREIADGLDAGIEIDDMPLNAADGIMPWYLGFKGSIEPLPDKPGCYLSRGIYNWADQSTLDISELPVGVWTDTFKEELVEALSPASSAATSSPGKRVRVNMMAQVLKDFENSSTTKNVRFKIKLTGDSNARENIERTFKLYSSKDLAISNMHLFNEHGVIEKFADIKSVIRAWAKIRVRVYNERKAHQLAEMERDHAILSAKVRFIAAIIANEIEVMNVAEEVLEARLEELEFPRFASHQAAAEPGYDYLTSLPIRQLTAQRKEAIERDLARLWDKLELLRATPIQLIWARELEALEKSWEKYRDDYLADIEADIAPPGAGTKRRRAAAKK